MIIQFFHSTNSIQEFQFLYPHQYLIFLKNFCHSNRYIVISHCDFLLNLTPKTKATKGKINKWDYIKQKSFCTAKEIINKMKGQPTEWEKIFANHIPGKGFISKIYIEPIQLIAKNQTIPLKNGQRI